MTGDVHTPTPTPVLADSQLMRTMTTAVAQHLRNPLAGISGALHVLRGRTPPESEEWLIFTEMLARMRAVDESISDLLDLTHPLSPKRRSMSASELVHHCGRVLAESGLGPIEIDVPPSLEICGDPALLRRAVAHLLRNGAELDAGAVRVSARASDEITAIEVTDTGCGGADARLIFEPFYTTKSSHLGLGLTIARRIARAHEGDVECVATGPSGTTMALYVSRVSGAPPRSSLTRR